MKKNILKLNNYVFFYNFIMDVCIIKLVFIHTEKSCITSYYSVALLANKTGINFIVFHFTIRGKMYIIRYDEKLLSSQGKHYIFYQNNNNIPQNELVLYQFFNCIINYL